MILFVSQRKKERILFWTIAGLVVVLFAGVSLMIFPFSWMQSTEDDSALGGVKSQGVDINFTVLKSKQVKELEVFPQPQKEYSYQAQDKNGTKTQGVISADSKTGATAALTAMGLTSISLQEIEVGKSDPFTSY